MADERHLAPPTFALTIGRLSSSGERPVGGPQLIVVERDMDMATDAAQILLVERAGIAPGDPVAIDLGPTGAATRAFTGAVAALRPSVGGVLVYALGTLRALLNLRVAVEFERRSAGAIMRDLVARAGLVPGSIDDGPILPRYVLDYRQSAWAHLKRLADRLGYEVYADRLGRVMIHAPGAEKARNGGGVLQGSPGASTLGPGGARGARYVFGSDLIAIKAYREPAAWRTLRVGGESPMSERGERAAHWLTTEEPGGDADMLALDPAARTRDLAERFAAGRKAVVDRQAHEIELRVPGRPELDLGDTVTITGCPDPLLDGQGYVRAVGHRYSGDDGFVTQIRVCRTPETSITGSFPAF